MNHCNHCQAELVCEYVPPNRTYQCPACGCPNTFGEHGGGAGLSKYARKSLIYTLGAVVLLAAAVVLLFMELPRQAGFAGPPALLLGIAATYFGIRAFLLSRYQPFSKRSRYEAISGMLGGGCLGIIIGGVVTIALIMSLVAQWFTFETQDKNQVAQALHATAKFEFPDSIELLPAVAKKSPVRKRIELWDNESFDASRNRLYLMWSNSVYTTQWGSSEQNRNGIRQGSIELITGNLAYQKTDETKTEELEWTINGATQKVAKVHWSGTTEENAEETENLEFVTYQCLFDANHNTYCLTFLSKLPDPTVSESEIQATFESFEPVGSGW